MLPSGRSLNYFRKFGWKAEVAEKWNHFAKQRKDLLGFIDIIVLRPGFVGVLGAQVTTQAHMNERIRKITQQEGIKQNALLWLRTGNPIVVHGWAKKGPRGRRKLWQLRQRAITESDF